MSTLMSQARNRVPRFAEAAVERARLTVVPRGVQKAPKVPFVSLVSLVLVGGVIGLLLFNTNMQQLSFTATTLQSRAAVLGAQEQSLQMHLETLRDPQKVAARAKVLRMVPASSPAFIRLSDGAVLGNPSVADPLEALRISPLPTRRPANLRPDPVIVKVEKTKAKPADAVSDAVTGATDRATGSGAKKQQGSDR